MKMSEWKEQGAWIWVRWNTGAPQDAWKEWVASNLKVWSTTGEWDCKVWVPAKSADEIEQFVWNKVRKNKWVKDTKTEWAWQCAA
jgi:hypothetical protein